jgi:cytochrome c
MHRAQLAVLVLAPLTLLAVTPAARADDPGEKIFKTYCSVCHTVEPGKNKIGPSLAGVVGRKAGTAPGYSYSDANKKSGITWTEEELDKYLTDPRAVVPGTKMIFAGLKNPDQRKAVIAYLKEQK